MSDKCSFRGALEAQQTENHQRVSQRRLSEYDDKPEKKPVVKPGKAKRSKPHRKGSSSKSKR